MKEKIILIAFLLISSLLISGCTTRLIDFTIISTKNLDISRVSSYQRGDTRTSGEDTKHIIIIIPTGRPSAKEAVDRALEAVPGAIALLDGVLTYKWYYIPYIFGENTYVVEGTPLINPELASTSFETNYMVATVDKNGEMEEFRFVSEKEYQKIQKKYIPKS